MLKTTRKRASRWLPHVALGCAVALLLLACLSPDDGRDGGTGSQGEVGVAGVDSDVPGDDGRDHFFAQPPSLALLDRSLPEAGQVQVRLQWDHTVYEDLSPVSYQACVAQEPIIDIANCQAHSGALRDVEVDADEGLITAHDAQVGSIYYARLQMRDDQRDDATDGVLVSDLLLFDVHVVNPTNMDWWADSDGERYDTSQPAYPGQNADHDLAAVLQSNEQIHASFGNQPGVFDWDKVDESGQPRMSSASVWACVRDHRTGLLWDAKNVAAGHYRAVSSTYSWLNMDPDHNGGHAGVPDGGECPMLEECDTEAYINALNEIALCGSDEWRIPEIGEVLSLGDHSDSAEMGINTDMFPRMESIDPSVRVWTNQTRLESNQNVYVMLVHPDYPLIPVIAPKGAVHTVMAVAGPEGE